MVEGRALDAQRSCPDRLPLRQPFGLPPPRKRGGFGHRNHERGAALLTVLLIVAVVAVLAATALERMRLSTRLAQNAVALDQARAYAMAAETLATTRISAILARDATRVTLQGDWANRPVPLPVPQGLATARVRDGGNCFNLNGLVERGVDGRFVARPASIEQFARLMRLIGITGQSANGIAAATADWIDSDDSPQPNGAEDSSYAGRSPRYRTPGQLMADVSELRAVAGVTPEVYAKLRPWVCALPRAAPVKLNVNTLMPEQAPLLAMLLPDTLDVGRARGLLAARPPLGFASTVSFWQGLSAQGVSPGQEGPAQTAVTTQWFVLDIDVELGGTQLSESAVVDATEIPVRLVSRGWSDPS
ncbi:MAG: type II secretion system minor pseudopilin GspK [Sphingomonas sp.]|nr:type II secretion system minor pseudopilin GspK [Sphingomonas sp.]